MPLCSTTYVRLEAATHIQVLSDTSARQHRDTNHFLSSIYLPSSNKALPLAMTDRLKHRSSNFIVR